MSYLPEHSDLEDLTADDHSQYLLLTAGSTRPLTGNLFIHPPAGGSTIYLGDYAGDDYGVVQNNATSLDLFSVRGSGPALVTIDPGPLDNTSESLIAMFRNADTVGTRHLILYLGDGTATQQHTFNSGTGDVDLCQQAGELTVGGSVVLPTRTVTSSTDTPTGRDHVILCDATSNTVTINLPTAVGIEGRVYNIKAINVDNAVTVDANGTEEIDGSATAITLALMEVITIQSDGSNWWII